MKRAIYKDQKSAKGPFTQAIFVAATRCNFFRAKLASSFKHVPNPKFECDLCDADYVGYTARHLHQCINEHKYSAIGRHLEQHGLLKTDLVNTQFSVLKKCRS